MIAAIIYLTIFTVLLTYSAVKSFRKERPTAAQEIDMEADANVESIKEALDKYLPAPKKPAPTQAKPPEPELNPTQPTATPPMEQPVEVEKKKEEKQPFGSNITLTEGIKVFDVNKYHMDGNRTSSNSLFNNKFQFNMRDAIIYETILKRKY